MSLDSEEYTSLRLTAYKNAGIRANSILETIPASRNREVTSVALSLLQSNTHHDVKSFVLDKEILGEFDLKDEYGIDPTPLFNMNNVTTEFRKKVRSLYKEEEVDLQVQGKQFIEEIQEIRTQRLFGRHTESKLAYIRNMLGVSLNLLLKNPIKRQRHLDAKLRFFQETTLALLRRQKHRLGDVPKAVNVDSMVKKIKAHVFKHEFHELAATHPACAFDIEEFCRIYADEIMQCAGEHLVDTNKPDDSNARGISYRKNKDIEVAYAPRNDRFLKLGDSFGDCTAKEVRSQVDPEIANIHWTVYPWLLDPYYRVLETYVDGESVLKGHITPLIIRQIPVLAVDAVEVVPKMRDMMKGKKNEYLSERLFNRRNEILDALLETAKSIGKRMGVEQVIVDKFSNAAWVRERLGKLTPKFYHVNDVEKPFGAAVIQKIVTDVLGVKGVDVKIEEEIQAVNLKLWSQELRYGYKDAGLLAGHEENARGVISGP